MDFEAREMVARDRVFLGGGASVVVCLGYFSFVVRKIEGREDHEHTHQVDPTPPTCVFLARICFCKCMPWRAFRLVCNEGRVSR